MFSITSQLLAGTEEEQRYFAEACVVRDAVEGLKEIHAGHMVFLAMDAWQLPARSILMGLGAPQAWAEDVIGHAVEFRKVGE